MVTGLDLVPNLELRDDDNNDDGDDGCAIPNNLVDGCLSVRFKICA